LTYSSTTTRCWRPISYTPTAGEYDTLLSIGKARKLLGYEPRWPWRNHLE
jgi:hypothetical protein